MKERIRTIALLLLWITTVPLTLSAQNDASVSARIDKQQVLVGDRASLLIEARHNPMRSKLQWAHIPDTFNHLEIADRGAIDTLKEGDLVTYRQKLGITGFDSGQFLVPSFVFSVIPNQGIASTIQTDSFPLLVQTVAVDTTRPFRPIKDIMELRSSWKDYIWLIVGIALFVALATFVLVYFLRQKQIAVPEQRPQLPTESLQEKALRLLSDLEQEQVWQSGRVKEYYVRLTEIVRSYIELRFGTAALELTTDELLDKAGRLPALQPFGTLLATILRTADLAKFARAQPLPGEHTDAMKLARQLVIDSTPPPTNNSENKQQ